MNPKSEKEVEAVLRLDGPERFRHFVKQVVDFETAWGVWNNGWVLMANDGGTSVFPLWPAREYVERCCTGTWANYEPRPITLDELLDDFLPNFAERGILPGVFPTPNRKGVTPSSDELAAALRKYDDESYG